MKNTASSLPFEIDLSAFIEAHQLPKSYQQTAEKWFFGLAQSIAESALQQNKPIVIGLNGTQGSGKSTLADLLVTLLGSAFSLKAVALSLDDFYLTRAERQSLAERVHPLLATRGVPGTHDTALAMQVIQSLKSKQLPVHVPRFNKAIDDRAEALETLTQPVDIIIFEGWCVGTAAQSAMTLQTPVNSLEAEEDQEAIWRTYVNDQLSGAYQDLFGLVDSWVMLQAPSFDCVYQWRLEQEDKLRQKAGDGQQVMSAAQVARFIQFYQRLTEQTLQTLPSKAQALFTLNPQRKITQLSLKPFTIEKLQWLIFTDMDGTLLDHHDYAFDPAKPMLATLAAQGIPVMPITSKTQAELETLRLSLDNTHPFIIENGAAVLIPKGYFAEQPEDTVSQGDYWVKHFVAERAHWQGLIQQVSDDYQGQFVTFEAAGIEGIIEMTGLPRAAAEESAQRQFGEPMQWLGGEASKQAMLNELRALGANILEGGRFIHVSGLSDKGVALHWLHEVFKLNQPDKTMLTVALGDSQNDVAMLESADYAVVVKSPVKAPPVVNRAQNLLITHETGPAGWAEGIQHFTNIRPESLGPEN